MLGSGVAEEERLGRLFDLSYIPLLVWDHYDSQSRAVSLNVNVCTCLLPDHFPIRWKLITFGPDLDRIDPCVRMLEDSAYCRGPETSGQWRLDKDVGKRKLGGKREMR